MPGHAVNLLKIVTEDDVHTEGFDPVDIGNDLSGVLLGILEFELGGSGGRVDQGVIEDDVAARGENLRRLFYRFGEVGDHSQCREEEVAEAVSVEVRIGLRCWNRRDSRASSSDSATMQLRMSPGGSMLNSLRRRPLEPPSSVTVTTAESSVIRSSNADMPGFGLRTYFLRPFSRFARPLPPPMAMTCS